MSARLDKSPERILVIKLRYVGDVVLSTPVLSRLRAAWPKARITMLVNRGTEGVLQGHPDVDEVLVKERSLISSLRLIGTLRGREFNAVIDLTDGDRSAILARATGARVRLGYNSEARWRGRLYTTVIQADRFKMHIVAYHLAATDRLGLAGPLPSPSLIVGEGTVVTAERLVRETGIDPHRPFVCLHPGARWWFKSWPAERFAALADRIQQEIGTPALFLGSNQDKAMVSQIAGYMKTVHRNLAGRTGLQELAGVLKLASLMITNDNGPMHMAAAMRVPVVGLFGPTDPLIWGPWGAGHRTFHKGLDCRACFHPDCFRGEQNCMRLISLDEVWEAVRERLMG